MVPDMAGGRLLVVMLFLAGLMLAAVPAAAAPPKCGICAQDIQGRYLIYTRVTGQKMNICAACDSSRPRCATCRIPMAGGRSHCADCVARAPRCNICSNPIGGRYQYFDVEGQTYNVCPTCARTRPRCTSCRVPFAAERLQLFPNQSMWCAPCLRDAAMCETCKSPIAGKYYQLDGREGTWCAACYENQHKCQVCQAPVGRVAAWLPDGRHMCTKCADSSITGSARMEEIAARVRPTMNRLLGREVERVTVRAVSLQELRRLFDRGGIQRSSNVPEGFIQEMGLFRIDGRTKEIVILDTIPEDIVWETIAHEMAHAWQIQHYPECKEDLLCEGFAQWVAEQVCIVHGRTSTLPQLRTRTDLYGRGYRLFRDAHARGGRDEVFRLLERGQSR